MEQAAQIKPRRKLNKAQVLEILERNMSLYRHEDNFHHYLIDLAVYLLEYEYDWSDSGEPPPNLKPRPEDAPLRSAAPPPATSNGKRVSVPLQPGAAQRSRITRECPFCGGEVGESGICTKCRNVAR